MLSNTVTLLAGRGLGLVFAGAAAIVLGRHLGRNLLGEYGGLCAYLSLNDWLTTFGLQWILAREAAKERQQGGSILVTGVVLSCGFSLLATLAALLLAPVFGYPGHLRILLLFASVDLLILAPLRLPVIVFQVDLRQWYAVGIGLFREMLWLSLVIAVAVFGRGLVSVFIARIACGAAEVISILLLTYHRGRLSRPWRFMPGKALEYASCGFPIAVSALAVGIYNRIDQVMLHYMTNDQVLGGYVAAVNITGLFVLLPVAVMASLFPTLSRLSSDEARFGAYLSFGFRIVMGGCIGICIVVSPLATALMSIVYGKEFVTAGNLLAVLIWSEVPVFFGIVISNGIIAKNFQRCMPYAAGLGAVVNVLLNLALIPRWGAMGAVWATNLSYAVAGVVVFLFFPQTSAMARAGLRTFSWLLLLALTGTIAMSMLKLSIGVELLLGSAVYLLGVFFFGIVRRSELSRVAGLIRMNIAWLRSTAS